MPEVKLLHPHTHQGIFFETGITINVSESEARWLMEQKIIERVQLTTVINANHHNNKPEAKNGATG